MIFGFALSKMMEVIFCEYEGKPIRINEVVFSSDVAVPGKIDVYFNCITAFKAL